MRLSEIQSFQSKHFIALKRTNKLLSRRILVTERSSAPQPYINSIYIALEKNENELESYERYIRNYNGFHTGEDE